MYYIYNDKSEIISKSFTQPAEGIWCKSDENFDLDLDTVTIGSIDANKNITFRTVKAKPAEQLAASLAQVKAQVTYMQAAMAVIQARS